MDSDDSLPPFPVFSVLERGNVSESLQIVEKPAPLPEQPSGLPACPPGRPARSLNASAVLKAAGDTTRWRVLRELSKGTAIPIGLLAQRLAVPTEALSKHLMVLRRCGAIADVRGTDARFRFQAIPHEFAPRVEGTDRVLDYGSCVLRFPQE